MGERNYKIKKCVVCQQDFQPTGPRHATCDSCAAVQKIEASASGRKPNRTCDKCGAGRSDAKCHVDINCDGVFVAGSVEAPVESVEPVAAPVEPVAAPVEPVAAPVEPVAAPGSHESWKVSSSIRSSEIGSTIGKILQEVQTLTYRKSENGDDFDTANMRIFERHGLRKLPKADAQEYERMRQNHEIGYVTQPYGSQQAPDFLLFLGEYGVLPWETKRSQTGEVMWNGGYPRPNTLYVYGGFDKKNDGRDVTFLWGSALNSWEEVRKYEDAVIAIRNAGDALNCNLLAEARMQVDFVRPMFKERAGERRWLSHPDRKQRESSVVSFFGEG